MKRFNDYRNIIDTLVRATQRAKKVILKLNFLIN